MTSPLVFLLNFYLEILFYWGGPAYCGERHHLLPAEVTLYLFYNISLPAQQYLPLETVCTTEGTTDTQIQALIIPVTSHHNGDTYTYICIGLFCLCSIFQSNYFISQPQKTWVPSDYWYNNREHCCCLCLPFYVFHEHFNWDPPLTRLLRGLTMNIWCGSIGSLVTAAVLDS